MIVAVIRMNAGSLIKSDMTQEPTESQGEKNHEGKPSTVAMGERWESSREQGKQPFDRREAIADYELKEAASDEEPTK